MRSPASTTYRQNGRPEVLKKCCMPSCPGRGCASPRSEKAVGSSGSLTRAGANNPCPASRPFPGAYSASATKTPAGRHPGGTFVAERRCVLEREPVVARVEADDPAVAREQTPAPARGQLEPEPVGLEDHATRPNGGGQAIAASATSPARAARARSRCEWAWNATSRSGRSTRPAASGVRPRTAPKQPTISSAGCGVAGHQRGDQRDIRGGARDDGRDADPELRPEAKAVHPAAVAVQPVLVDLAARAGRRFGARVERGGDQRCAPRPPPAACPCRRSPATRSRPSTPASAPEPAPPPTAPSRNAATVTPPSIAVPAHRAG